MKQRQFH